MTTKSTSGGRENKSGGLEATALHERDGDEQVIVARNRTSDIFHTTSHGEETDCHANIANQRVTTVAELRRVGYGHLELCDNCSHKGRGGNDGAECPYCGDEVGSLPMHLPCDAVPEVEL